LAGKFIVQPPESPERLVLPRKLIPRIEYVLGYPAYALNDLIFPFYLVSMTVLVDSASFQLEFRDHAEPGTELQYNALVPRAPPFDMDPTQLSMRPSLDRPPTQNHEIQDGDLTTFEPGSEGLSKRPDAQNEQAARDSGNAGLAHRRYATVVA
jgi:hypothetical protein